MVVRAPAGTGLDDVFTDCAGHSSSLHVETAAGDCGADCANAEFAVHNTTQSRVARVKQLKFRCAIRGKDLFKRIHAPLNDEGRSSLGGVCRFMMTIAQQELFVGLFPDPGQLIRRIRRFARLEPCDFRS